MAETAVVLVIWAALTVSAFGLGWAIGGRRTKRVKRLYGVRVTEHTVQLDQPRRVRREAARRAK